MTSLLTSAHHTLQHAVLNASTLLHDEQPYGEPMFQNRNAPPVSTTAQCIVNLTAQYFFIYLCIAIFRTYNEATSRGKVMQNVFESLKFTLAYVPMLACLFLAVRMRAIMLSQGQTEKYNLPPDLCKRAMQLCTKGKGKLPENEIGNVDIALLENKMPAFVLVILNIIHYLTKIGVFLGFMFVTLSLVFMKGPQEIWEFNTPKVAPAVACTINLCAQFFIMQGMYSIVRTYEFFNLNSLGTKAKKVSATCRMACTTVQMAPMLCILFIGARMRALQMEPKYGSPQPWAQVCFYVCTYSVLAQTIFCLVVPFCSKNCTVTEGATPGDYTFDGISGFPFGVATFLRYCAILGMYGGMTAVMCSIFLIEAPNGPTEPISPALGCILKLCVQYFLIYIILFISETTTHLSAGLRESAGWVRNVMKDALHTVLFAPMLAVLFLMVRMRALQLTKQADGVSPPGAGPQKWAQDCMFISTWALLLQVVAVLVMACCYDNIPMDDEGTIKPPDQANTAMRTIVNVFRYLMMFCMYGSVIALCISLFVMEPESLPPWGHSQHIIPIHSLMNHQVTTVGMDGLLDKRTHF